MIEYHQVKSGRIHKEGGFILILPLIINILLIIVAYGYMSNYFVKIEDYVITSTKIREDTVFVLLTDLHDCDFYDYNSVKLLEKIDEISPDFVCIAGDMTLKNKKFSSSLLGFLVNLACRYPFYYAPGNHEMYVVDDGYMFLLKHMQVQYLKNEKAEAGNGICITGLDLPEYWYHKCWEKREMQVETLVSLTGEHKEDCFNILLAHNPEYFPHYAEWGADLTLSGHIHGGIARLPFIGGVIAPSLRLFPQYDAGKFERDGKSMIVSRGLGTHHIYLRFFNRPEISRIKIKKISD